MVDVALITGINGQDGSYLSELLLSKGYHVYGILRRTSLINTKRIDHLYKDGHFHTMYGDVTDLSNIIHIIQTIMHNHKDINRFELYNLAAQSHVKVSFEEPVYTAHTDAIGTLNMLEAIRCLKLENKIRFYQASTSELYGKVQSIPQDERTPFYPRSPYGVAKLYSYWIVKNYRESYNMYACNGILFNHESPRRGETFVTRKITIGIGKILRGEEEYLYLGNLDSKRDWGHAKDYVEGMWRMLQQEEPDDFVLATGECYSVRTFVELAFEKVGVKIGWKGTGIDEIGYDVSTGQTLVRVSEKYFRPAEVDLLLGDSTKARTQLGWNPTTTIHQLVDEMIENDCLR